MAAPAPSPSAKPRWSPLKELREQGIGFWVALFRRAVPWAVLAVALMQARALNIRVRELEDREMGAMEQQVSGLRQAIDRLRDKAEQTDRTLAEERKALDSIEVVTQRTKAEAPRLEERLVHQSTELEVLGRTIPPVSRVEELSGALRGDLESVQALRSALPPADAAGAVGAQLQQAAGAVRDVRAALPDQAKAGDLKTSMDAAGARLAELNRALPRAQDAKALGDALADAAARAKKLAAELPAPEEIDSLRKELERARASLKAPTPAPPPPAPAAASPTPAVASGALPSAEPTAAAAVKAR